jgi:ATP-dependent DNA helicase RecG
LPCYLTARELTTSLDEISDDLGLWLSRLVQDGVLQTSGKTVGMRYFVAPTWLRGTQLGRRTTLSRIAPHRLRALIIEDLVSYPLSASSEIKGRIGAEISAKTVKRCLDDLTENGQVSFEGERRWRRYRLTDAEHKGQNMGNDQKKTS